MLEHGRHVHDDERHRHLHGQVRPGRRRELQRGAAGHRDGDRAEGDQTITVTTHAPASAVYNTSFTVAATGGGSGQPGDLLEQRVLLERGRHLHDDERHRHLHRPVRPGAATQLQRCAAGDRDGERAEGRPDDHRDAPTLRRAPSTTRASVSRRTRRRPRQLLELRRLLEHGQHVHDDERHRHLQRQVRPGRQRELQRGPQVTETVNAQKANQAINVTTYAPASAFSASSSRSRRPAAARATR